MRQDTESGVDKAGSPAGCLKSTAGPPSGNKSALDALSSLLSRGRRSENDLAAEIKSILALITAVISYGNYGTTLKSVTLEPPLASSLVCFR